MVEDSLPSLSSASHTPIEQAIVALKKGAHLLKYGKRGKPKFCPFRLSMDEKFLLWYSGPDEKKLRLSKVTNIINGHHNTSTKQPRIEKESQCLSIVYENGKSSLELICKDEMQAECWFTGLRAVISRNYCHGTLASFEKERGGKSCINSPASFMRRKQVLGLSEKKTRSSEVKSSCVSPSASFSARCSFDGMSCSSNAFHSTSSLAKLRNTTNALATRDDVNNRAKMHILRDVYVWGEGVDLGGVEAHSSSSLPRLLHSATMLDVRSISLGTKHAAIVTNEGELFSWGEGKRGRLGHRVDMDALRPKLVESLSGAHVARVSCGTHHACAVTRSGEAYAWGDLVGGDDGRRGSHWLLHRLDGLVQDVTVSNVSCGEWHTAIVSDCGRLFTYGDGTFGALGHGNLESYSRPKEVESIKGSRVKSVACGPWHTAAVIEVTKDRVRSDNSKGKLFTWGDSDKGRLGHDDQERKLLPTHVSNLFDHDFVQVSCGDTLTAGLTSNGRVFTIGSAAYGQLGFPQAKDKSIVAVKGMLMDEFVVEISSGSFHVAVLTSRGKVYTWGRGENGQLGLGDSKDRHSPSLVETLEGRRVERVTCGSTSTAAICQHRSLSSADQLACIGCKNSFGFTRKKQNCYNCGRLFCRACSSKRSIHASLAFDEKRKPPRVCNECFNELQSVPCRVVSSKTSTPRFSSMLRKVRPYGMEGVVDLGQNTRTRSSCDGDCSCERKDVTSQDNACMDKALLRWGHVSCPRVFTMNFRDTDTGRLDGVGLEPSSEFAVRTLQDSVIEEKLAPRTRSEEKDLDEILKLKAQAKSLRKLCERREDKIRENKRKIEEAQSLTKEEAANVREANETIRRLTSKLSEMSEKVVQVEESSVENICRSPVVFSSKLRPLHGGDLKSGTKGIKCSNIEWVEQYQPGVFITLTLLQDGKSGLKRIRFSRDKFNEQEAKKWWEQNKQKVCRNYGVDD